VSDDTGRPGKRVIGYAKTFHIINVASRGRRSATVVTRECDVPR
jgi:hypothetical protein